MNKQLVTILLALTVLPLTSTKEEIAKNPVLQQVRALNPKQLTLQDPHFALAKKQEAFLANFIIGKEKPEFEGKILEVETVKYAKEKADEILKQSRSWDIWWHSLLKGAESALDHHQHTMRLTIESAHTECLKENEKYSDRCHDCDVVKALLTNWLISDNISVAEVILSV
jgi:hypothetical protein